MLKIILIILGLFGLSACGDLFMQEKSETQQTELSQLATCDLDITAFSYILEKNIKGEIVCLKDKLNLFMDIVKTDRVDYISKNVLKDFLVNGPFDVDQKVIDIIDSVFDLSFIIRGTEREYIKRSDVDVLLDFLIVFNQHIWKSYKYFKSPDRVNYSRHVRERDIVFNELGLITKKLREIYVPRREQVDEINTEKFLFNFFQGSISNLEKIRSLMFLKKVFLGGETWKLNHLEFAEALDVIPYIAQIAFDLVKMDRYVFENEQETLVKIFEQDIYTFEQILKYPKDSDEVLFSIYDLINVFVVTAPNALPVDISKYPKELMLLKGILLGDSSELFLAKDLTSLLEQSLSILNRGNLFYRVYEFYKDELNDTKPITHDFSDFPVKDSLEEKILKEFSEIVHNYKFVKGSFTVPFYTFDHRRNPNAYFQISVMEFLVKKVMLYYGRENDKARGGADMTLSQTVTLIDDFKWFLKDQGIITIGRKGGGEVAGVADNLVLMSTLFQYQSDGCVTDSVCMEVPETTEFIIGLLTALEVKDFFTATMVEYCQDHLDSYQRIAPTCFRENFINVIESQIPGDGRSLADYMPLFYEYLQELISDIPQDSSVLESKSYMKFITETESFTRSCMYYDEEDTDEVYLRPNDAFAVFAGLLNVESTLLRFDLDQNNNIDAWNSRRENEVLEAYYGVYKGAIIALVEGRVNNKMLAKLLAKPIFQYLVKYGEVPQVDQFKSIWKFVRFILRKNKSADISRTTVSTMLKTIGESSENAAKHPFKCEECLRDPTIECEPEGDPWE